jgi:hypothetical protein
MKILVTGDRNWRDAKMIYQALDARTGMNWETITLIHGDARGADTLADVCAQILDFKVKRYPADWDRYHRAAGVIRNQQMLDENPDIDLVLAFHDDIGNSKGTADMISRAERVGIEVILYKHE